MDRWHNIILKHYCYIFYVINQFLYMQCMHIMHIWYTILIIQSFNVIDVTLVINWALAYALFILDLSCLEGNTQWAVPLSENQYSQAELGGTKVCEKNNPNPFFLPFPFSCLPAPPFCAAPHVFNTLAIQIGEGGRALSWCQISLGEVRCPLSVQSMLNWMLEGEKELWYLL